MTEAKDQGRPSAVKVAATMAGGHGDGQGPAVARLGAVQKADQGDGEEGGHGAIIRSASPVPLVAPGGHGGSRSHPIAAATASPISFVVTA